MNTKEKVPPVPTYKESHSRFLPSMLDFYKNPEKYAIEPFRIFGNLYYVGDRKVCMHLIDTGDGLVLVDTGYGNTLHMIINSIRTLGFSPKDIKIIIHTHGHFDHFGSSIQLKSLYGCKLYIGKPDAERLKINPDTALMHLGPTPHGAIPEFDEQLCDGDSISLGNTTIRFQIAPGHTEGVLAFFFDATDGKETKRVGCWGGMGFLTMYKEYLKQYGLPTDLPLQMKKSIERLKNEKVEIALGNHPYNNHSIEKGEQIIKGENPDAFVDFGAWPLMLGTIEEKLEFFLANDY